MNKNQLYLLFVMIQTIKNDNAYNNALFVTQIIQKIIEIDNNTLLLDIEKELRNINSKIYLVGLPANSTDTTLYTILDFDHIPKNYFLYICMNGYDEMLDLIKKYNISIEENLDNLKNDTGYLFIKQ